MSKEYNINPLFLCHDYYVLAKKGLLIPPLREVTAKKLSGKKYNILPLALCHDYYVLAEQSGILVPPLTVSILDDEHNDIADEHIDIDEFLTADESYSLVLSVGILSELFSNEDVQAALSFSLSDSMFIWESTITGWILELLGELEACESLGIAHGMPVSDFLTAKESILSQWTGGFSLNEAVKPSDMVSIVKQIIESIEDMMEVSETVSPLLILRIAELLEIYEQVSSQGMFARSVSDEARIIDTALPTWLVSIIENLDLTDTQTLFLYLAISDVFETSDTASGVGTFGSIVADGARLTDEAKRTILQVLTDIVELVDIPSSVGKLVQSLTDSMALSDDPVALRAAVEALTDVLAASGSISSKATLYAIVQDSLRLNVLVVMDGEIWECYVLNTSNFHPSIYSGFDFNSYCVYENRAYGCNSEGIWEITGDTDNGEEIHTGLVLSETNFGSPNYKRMRKGFLGVSGANPVMIMETDNGEEVYSIDSDGVVYGMRSQLGKKWTLKIADFETLDYIRLVPVILTRRR